MKLRKGYVFAAAVAASVIFGGAALGAGAFRSHKAVAFHSEKVNADVMNARESAVRAAEAAKPAVVVATRAGRWTIGKSDSLGGETCVSVRAPQGWASGGCMRGQGSANQVPVDYISGGTPSVSYVFGLVRPDVTDLEIVADDCSHRTVDVNSGVFLEVFDVSAGDPRPYRLIGQSAGGSTIVDPPLPLRGNHAGSNPNC